MLIAWAALLAVSMAANIDLATSWANDVYDERILTAAAAASDTLKALAPVGFFLAWAWKNRSAQCACAILFAITQTFSATAAIGYASKARTGFYNAQEASAKKLEKLNAERTRIDQQLQWLPAGRERPIVEAEIAQAKAGKLYRASDSCTRAKGDEEDVFCRSYWGLEAEAATSDTRAGYVAAISGLDAQIDEVAGAGGDTQLATMVTMTGLTERQLIAALSVVVAVLIEMGSALGLVAATGVIAGRKRETPATELPSAPQAPPAPAATVAAPTEPHRSGLAAKIRPVPRAA